MQYRAFGISDNAKKLIITALSLLAAVGISLSGIIFGIYSWMNDISFKVANTQVSGVFFGILVTYLGSGYFLSVVRLKNVLYKKSPHTF